MAQESTVVAAVVVAAAAVTAAVVVVVVAAAAAAAAEQKQMKWVCLTKEVEGIIYILMYSDLLIGVMLCLLLG